MVPMIVPESKLREKVRKMLKKCINRATTGARRTNRHSADTCVRGRHAGPRSAPGDAEGPRQPQAGGGGITERADQAGMSPGSRIARHARITAGMPR